jgi:hypothetical protein
VAKKRRKVKHVMDQLIRTNAELELEETLKRLNIDYELYMIYHFPCGKRFSWISFGLPDYCLQCKQALDYDFCRPDYIIKSGGKTGVIRVDGSIHEKARIMKRDKFITKELIKNKVRVFILKNEEILRATEIQMLGVVNFIKDCMTSDQLYKLYTSSGDYKERAG